MYCPFLYWGGIFTPYYYSALYCYLELMSNHCNNFISRCVAIVLLQIRRTHFNIHLEYNNVAMFHYPSWIQQRGNVPLVLCSWNTGQVLLFPLWTLLGTGRHPSISTGNDLQASYPPAGNSTLLLDTLTAFAQGTATALWLGNTATQIHHDATRSAVIIM